MISAIAKMAPKTRFFVSLLIALAAGGGLFTQGLMPQVQALKAEQIKFKQMEPAVKLKRLQLEKIKPELTEPVPLNSAHRDLLLSNNASLFDESSRIAFISSLPDIARTSGVHAFNIKEVPDTPGDEVIIRPDKDKPKEIVKIRKRPLTVTFRGEFQDIMIFFERLRDRGGYMKISALKMTANRKSGGLNVDMTLYLYCEEQAQQ